MTAAQAAIRTNGLTKDYGDRRGCRNVTLTVQAGEAFGFLGPNGAGKSTLVKMLVGLISPTAGSAELYGHPAGSVEARRRIGYLPELFRYPEWLTGVEALRFHARLCGLDHQTAERRIAELLDEVGIGRRGYDRIKKYSKGMQQRLGLACALIGSPDLVFLDEPASALDPVGRHEVREILKRLKERGTTIFLNSHLLEDVEQICDRMALLNNGQVLAEGSIADVLRERSRWHVRVGGYSPVVAEWLSLAVDAPVRVRPDLPLPPGSDSVWLEAELENEEQIGRLHYLIVEQGLTLYEARRADSGLEQWFLQAVSGLEHRGEGTRT